MFVAIYTTINNKQHAQTIAHTLIHEKLCACVNILECVESVYRWKGAIEMAHEIVLLAKTTETNVKKTMRRIQELHNYEIPDIVVFPIVDGSKNYLDYITRETT